MCSGAEATRCSDRQCVPDERCCSERGLIKARVGHSETLGEKHLSATLRDLQASAHEHAQASREEKSPHQGIKPASLLRYGEDPASHKLTSWC